MFRLNYCKINTHHSFTDTRNQQLAMFLLDSTSIEDGICSVSYLEMTYRLHCSAGRFALVKRALRGGPLLLTRSAVRSLATVSAAATAPYARLFESGRTNINTARCKQSRRVSCTDISTKHNHSACLSSPKVYVFIISVRNNNTFDSIRTVDSKQRSRLVMI
jgi:hypothetical protein